MGTFNDNSTSIQINRKAPDIKHTNRKIWLNRGLKENIEYLTMCFPSLLHIFVFCYIPMFGVVIAFKKFRYDKGIFGSEWIGFENFKFFFSSQDAWRVTRNTIFLNFLFIIAGLVCSVAFALMLYEINRRIFVKVYQTIMILPSFLSWVVVGYMTYAFLNPNLGFLNHLFEKLGLEPLQWFSEPGYWPAILVLVSIWKGVGISSIIYYAGLIGVNREYYEAAEIDGANKLQMIFKISIPFLVPLMIILTILAIGGIFRSDFGMFYNVTRDVGILYPTTDVIDTYVYRALRSVGDIGMSTAVGLYQSAVGFVLVIITNAVVRRIKSENALF